MQGVVIREALAAARQQLHTISEAAAYEARLMLEYVTQKPAAWLLAHDDARLTDAQTRQFQLAVQKRASGYPAAYILGYRGFYHWDFEVSPDVLIPRPETELLVERVAASIQGSDYTNRPPTIVDVGTGSGIIAISLALLFPEAVVWATDISAAALSVARRNAERLGARHINFAVGHLLRDLPDTVQPDVVVANLPYIPRELLTTLDVARWEPMTALDGGADGLTLIRELLESVRDRPSYGNLLALEIGADQGAAIQRLVQDSMPDATLTIYPDLAKLDRIAMIQRSESLG
ncbi:MAG: peptide chain release factor N(5)-glutamine methyltransferase [Chloroflexi bacterium]|nr:peptide chain release factor N(5)-glutamine methyltransferase [Chloroflexota bacterium]